MSLSTMLSRRKPTTYGKSSRPHVPNLSPAAGDEFGRAPMQSSQDSAKEIRFKTLGAQMPSNRISTSGSKYGAKKTSEARTLDVSKPCLGGRKNASERLKNVQSPSEKGPISPNSDTDALYNVPSSDEEEWSGKSDLHGPTVGKRRKITSAATPRQTTYVYDDETLQRHVAAEDCMHSRQSPARNARTAGKRKLRSSQVLTKKSRGRSVDPTLGHHQVLSAAQSISKRARVPTIDNASKAKIRTKSLVSDLELQEVRKLNCGGDAMVVIARTKTMPFEPRRSSENTRVSSNMCDELVQIGVGVTTPRSRNLKEESGSSRMASSRPHTPPQTPPKSTTPIGGSITPRQREIWGMLFKDDARISSPSSLDLPNLKITDPKADNPPGYKASRQGRIDAAHRTRPTRNSRRRLVDNLQGVDENECDSSSDADEKTTGDSDDASSNGRPQAPLELDILANNASKILNRQRNELQARKPAISNLAQPSSQGVAPKVTYARERSYLTEDGLGDAAIFGEPTAHLTAAEAVKGRRRARATVAELEPIKHPHDQTDNLECSQGGTIRSIHELREAGGAVRLLTEMETMLDDINEKNAVSVTLKRAALLDLVAKLREASFCRLFIGQGLELRLLANVGTSNDVIVNILHAVAIWHLLVDPRSIQILHRVSAENVVNHLVGLLDNDQDVAQLLRDRKLNISKVAQQDFKEFFSSLLESPNWRAGRPPALTPRVLCLQCLEYLIRQIREVGSEAQVLTPHAIRRIVKLLNPTTPSLTSQPAIIVTTDLRLAVSILESCTLSGASPRSEKLWTDETLDIVTKLLPQLVPLRNPASGTLQTLVLRFYMNLTNNSPELCKAFSKPNLISAVFDIVIPHFRYLSDNTTDMESSLILDNLILSLGSLLNLAEWCEDLGQMVLGLRYGDMTFLHSLLEIFMAKLQEASEVSSPWLK